MKKTIIKACIIVVALLFSTTTTYSNLLLKSLNNLKNKLIVLSKKLTAKPCKINPTNMLETTDAASNYLDETTFTMIYTEKSQWTFFPNRKKLDLSVHNQSAPLFDKIPAIGHYLSEGYNFRNRLVTIECQPQDLSKIGPKSLLSITKTNPVSFYITITGTVRDTNKDSNDQTYNILFHGFRAPDFSPNASVFGSKENENILMGAFNENGVEDIKKSASMPFNKAEKRSVHYHDFHFSPNNARIKLSKNRNISTFWTLAISPKNNRTAVTYHLLLNNKKTEALFEKSFTQDSFDKLIAEMETAAISLSNKDDKMALQEFIDNLSKLMEYKP